MTSDVMLLRQYAETRDADAFAELVRRYAGMVYGACMRITGSAHDAEDVAQECFLQLARRAGSVEASVAGWLHAAATRRSLNAIRNASTRRRHEQRTAATEATAPDGNGGELAWEDIAPHVDQALEELPPELRVPLVHHYLEGRSQTEIAAELGVDHSTVSRRVKKALGELREKLKMAGVVAPAAALTVLLSESAAAEAPPTLMATLAKMAMAGVGGKAAGGAAAATVATLHGKFAVGVAASLIAVCATVAYTQSAKTVKQAGAQPKSKAASKPSEPAEKPEIGRKLPAGLQAAFMIPTGGQDQHGNPVTVRDGKRFDPDTGWPYEIWLREPRMELVLIPAGEFMMGSALAANEVIDKYSGGIASPRALATYEQEHPQHAAQIKKPLYLGKYEVTNNQYRFVRPHHSSGQRWGHSLDGHYQPVALVSWDDIFEFCGSLTTQSRAPFRLPTEAEWEYACRAGTQSVWYWGDEMDATYCNMCDKSCRDKVRAFPWVEAAFDDGHAVAAPVGRFKPNAFGLYDLSGNVWEFCSSEFRPYPYRADDGREDLGRVARRVVRGGAWGSGSTMHRSANRFGQTQDYVGMDRGFRVAVSVSAERHEGLVPPSSAGSMELLYRLRADAKEAGPDLVRSTIRILRDRLASTMAAQCHLEARGTDQVLVRIRRGAGVDVDRLRSLIEARGQLEFRLCSTSPIELKRARLGESVAGHYRHWAGLRRGESPRPGAPRPRWYLVEERVRITGPSLADAYVTPRGQGGNPSVGFRMNDAGADALGRLTEANIGTPIAILIDGKLMTAPIVRARIAGAGIINGRFTREEAEDLARILRMGPLPAEMVLVSLDGRPLAERGRTHNTHLTTQTPVR